MLDELGVMLSAAKSEALLDTEVFSCEDAVVTVAAATITLLA